MLASLAASAGPLGAKPKPAPAPDGAEITFVGFSSNGSTGTVYVDMSEPAEVKRLEADGTVSFLIEGAVIHGKNNLYPLPTEQFGTPVKSVRLVPTDDGAKLQLQVAGKPVVTQKFIKGESGSRLTVQAAPGAGSGS